MSVATISLILLPARLRHGALKLVLTGLLCGAGFASAGPVVQTDKGAIEGLAEEGTQSFLGVPFAAPPIGPLRWRAPAPVPSWSGVRPATASGLACTQVPVPAFGIAPSGEDCLYLNVHLPADVNQPGPLPVMVFLHGGGFVAGAGSAYDGRELARKTNTVVVTVNYRLGIFGFLALPSLSAEDKAGNHALQDQQAALKWVQRNIARFGGDKHRVTLFGQSAGGISVCHQLVSPGAKGLFHRAIVQSGPCNLGATTQDAARVIGAEFAAKAGCPEGPDQLACLRAKSAAEVMAAGPQLELQKVSSVLPVMPWVDGVVVPGQPMDMFKQGRLNRMPVMVGANQDDANFLVGLFVDLARGAPLTEAELPGQIQTLVKNEAAQPSLGAIYTSQNFGSPNLALSALATDGLYVCSSLRTAKVLSHWVPTFAYEFADRSLGAFVPDPFLDWGAYHASEMRYLLGTAQERSILSPQQAAHADRMMRYWARFAASGNPNGKQDAIWPHHLPLTSATQRLTLDGGETAWGWHGKGVYGDHRCDLWGPATAIDTAIR